MSIHSLSKPELIERVNYQKSKTKWYMDENMNLKRRIRDFDERLQRELAKKDAVIAQKDEVIATLKKERRNIQGTAKQERFKAKKRSKQASEVKSQLLTFQKEIQYLSKDLEWDKESSRQMHIEIIVRAIITYNKLTSAGTITFNEFAFLLAGAQKEYFSLEDLKDRYGDLGRRVKSNIVACIEAGYLKKVLKKTNMWCLTNEGRNRLNDILKHIYTEKVGIYKIVKKAALINETTQ